MNLLRSHHPHSGRKAQRRMCVALSLGLGLAACSDPEAERAAAAAQAAAQETLAEDGAKAFDAAAASEDWRMAKSHAEILLHDHPNSAAAARVRERYDEVKAKAEHARESQRLAALWSYDAQSVQGGTQLSTSIYAKEEIELGGLGSTSVRLIFRDHPSWGRSSYLVMNLGDFDCYGGCRVKVSVDGGAPVSLPGTRPKTDEAIAMFIDDERRMWRLTREAKTISVEFPTKGAGARSATFEVDGLDPNRMPKWN